MDENNLAEIANLPAAELLERLPALSADDLKALRKIEKAGANLDTIITEKTKLVAVTMMSNVTGAITPLNKIIARARAVGAVTVIDAAQSAPHAPRREHRRRCAHEAR